MIIIVVVVSMYPSFLVVAGEIWDNRFVVAVSFERSRDPRNGRDERVTNLVTRSTDTAVGPRGLRVFWHQSQHASANKIQRRSTSLHTLRPPQEDPFWGILRRTT
jgi:hypothetical protein